jgi:hypothetical protein
VPKELARVMTRYAELQKKVAPLLHELHDHEMTYIGMRDRMFLATDELVERLTALKATSAADPRAARDPAVQDSLEQLEKYKSLMADRHAFFEIVSKKVDAIRVEAGKLEKDVAAVIKAKSGFFSTSKSLPQLKALAANLIKFADELETATRGT